MSETGERSSVTVRIAGEEHTIRSSAEAEYTEACARHVDERIREIRKRSGLLDPDRAAILAALSITDECFQAREESERLRKEVTSRATNLVRRIEAGLGAAGGEGVEDAEPGEGEGAHGGE